MAALLTAGSLWATPPETEEWFMHTDTDHELQMYHVTCLLAPDGAETFAVLMDDNTLYDGVSKVTFARSVPAGIDNVASDKEISVLTDMATNSLSVTGAQGKTADIFDANGRLLIKQSLSATDKIDVSALASGMYMLKIGGATVKFIKK